MIFSGASGVKLYTAVALKHGLRLYIATGLKPNTAWTPKAMLAMASEITGVPFKRGQYDLAIAALETWLENSNANR